METEYKFMKRKTFYPFPVYEFNLPSGWSCPFANECKVCVDRITGKFNRIGNKFRCYASSSERFPNVRKARWHNFDLVKKGIKIEIPKDATHIRIHGSGDFFTQWYFDEWLEIAIKNPKVRFWAFTKSVQFWVNRLDKIPTNLILQASKGGFQDDLIEKHDLKFAEVFLDIKDVPEGMKIDVDDTLAMNGNESFALLDNFKYKKSATPKIKLNTTTK